MTRLSDRTDPVPDETWDEAVRHYDEKALAALVLWIATVNVFNRVNVARGKFLANGSLECPISVVPAPATTACQNGHRPGSSWIRETEDTNMEGAAMNMTLEVIPVPVSDTDRAIEFYRRLGFNVDMDRRINDALRFVQLTPPGSGCSIHIGEGTSTMKPGTIRGLILVVDSADEARAELVKRGIEVSGIEQQPWGKHVYFSDPDGNSWTVQESYARNQSRESAR